MHHPFTQPARGNQKRRSRPEFQNTTRSRRTQKTPAKPPPKPKTFHTQPTKRPRCNLAHTPNSKQQKPQPPTARTPNRPAPRRSRHCTKQREKWNLQKSDPNFLIGSKTIFDQKFFDLDLLSNKKANKNDNTERTSTKHHPGAEIFFTKTTKTTDLYKGFDHLYKASNTSTRQQNSAM
jgi:hypothetical protein